MTPFCVYQNFPKVIVVLFTGAASVFSLAQTFYTEIGTKYHYMGYYP